MLVTIVSNDIKKINSLLTVDNEHLMEYNNLLKKNMSEKEVSFQERIKEMEYQIATRKEVVMTLQQKMQQLKVTEANGHLDGHFKNMDEP